MTRQQGRQPGDATLALLAADGMLAVLAELHRRGEVRARDIESNLPGITRRTALRRLQTLAAHGYASVTGESDAGRPPAGWRGSSPGSTAAGRPGPARAPYALTELGRGCLPKVVEAAARCERQWCPPPPLRRSASAGLWTIELVADLPARAIVRALADAPLRQGELLARQPQFARSTLLGRLKMLSSSGLLVREAHSTHEVRYGLTDGARHLAIVAVRAAACEGRRSGARESLPADDLPGLLHVLAPLARVGREIAGACRWRLNYSPESDTYLTARAGRIAALGAIPTAALDADGLASAGIWGAALLSGERSQILVTGDEALFDAIFGGLSAALLA
jgi:DNA-binding HxlR family transcriptional regulator